MNSRIAGVGFVTVSLRKSMIGSGMFVLHSESVLAYRKSKSKIKDFNFEVRGLVAALDFCVDGK
jgi:hypothetical protein